MVTMEDMMKKVRISQVGGLDTKVIARMKDSGIAVLTSAKAPCAVALPFTGDRKEAARRYAALVADEFAGGAIHVGRLKTKLISKLRRHRVLVVSLRGEPVAILLPFPHDNVEANQSIGAYLR